jgi:two-component system phosphate regulon sensor histidine kinase PhoR
VINLIDNALKYAPHSGVVTVRAGRENGAIIVRVVDRGPGVAPEDRDRIFERFVRGMASHSHGSDRPVRGSGIGLALVKHIAQSHGGRAWVDAAPGGGASFGISIPVMRPLATTG